MRRPYPLKIAYFDMQLIVRMFPADSLMLRGNADSGDSCFQIQAETIVIGGKKSIVFSGKGINISIGAKQTAVYAHRGESNTRPSANFKLFHLQENGDL